MKKLLARLSLEPVPQIKQNTNKSSEKKNNFEFYNLQIFIPS